jgi:acetyl-CoA C-acetyltransferase
VGIAFEREDAGGGDARTLWKGRPALSLFDIVASDGTWRRTCRSDGSLSLNEDAGAVAIAGAGVTTFGRLEDSGFLDLAIDASRAALSDANTSASELDALFVGTYAGAVLGGQNFPAPIIAGKLGCDDIVSISVEAACASGSVALKQAVNAVRAGEATAALVIGVEKMTSRNTATVTAELSKASDTTSGGYRAGLTFPGFFGLIAKSYLSHYDIARELLAEVCVKNRRHGAQNPHAQFQREVTGEEVLESRMVAEPLRLLDCSAISDGAAALVVGPLEWVAARCDLPIQVLACEQASGRTSVEELDSFLSLPASVRAASRAFSRAGLSTADVDVAELHDCFTIAELIAAEDVGLIAPGCAAAATADGETTIGGRIPINPSGGLLAKGHPVGATGVAQVVEVVDQLRGEAANQVEGARIGLTHNVGGTGGLASVSLFASAV